MVSKRQVAEQGDFISDGYPAETCDIRNLLGNGRPKNEREEMPPWTFADQIREDKGRSTAILLQDLQKGLCHIRRLHIRWHESKRKKVGAF